MFTYTKLYQRAAYDCGINSATNSQALTNIQTDINQGLRNFKNAARKYWTRKEVVTNMVQGQMYYTFPADMVRITTIRATTGALTIPVTIVDSEELWNRLTLIPAMTIGIPTSAYIRGRNEVGLYPVPSTTISNGLIVSYEPRLKDMNIDDVTITGTISVTNGSTNVTATSGTPFNQNMIGMWFSVTDGSDGNWYQIVGFTSSTQITLENVYLGSTSTTANATIGLAPDIPEDYHLALSYYASANYYMQRNDKDTAAFYLSMYNQLLKDYKNVYSAKTTGLVQQDLEPYIYSLFTLPPMNMTG